MEKTIHDITIYYDGINIDHYGSYDIVKGYTTNPTLMKSMKSANYKDFAKYFLKNARGLPVSFEVFADDLDEMIEQGREISSWGDNIYVKIPIVNTKGDSTEMVIEQLNSMNIKVNVTAVFTEDQIMKAYSSMRGNVANIISIFSGRIADTGVDPIKTCRFAVDLFNGKNVQVLWASPREVLNIFHAIDAGCHIITINDAVFSKLHYINKDLYDFSIETVKMFHNDAIQSNISF